VIGWSYALDVIYSEQLCSDNMTTTVTVRPSHKDIVKSSRRTQRLPRKDVIVRPSVTLFAVASYFPSIVENEAGHRHCAASG
jgi:hypothetical protein